MNGVCFAVTVQFQVKCIHAYLKYLQNEKTTNKNKTTPENDSYVLQKTYTVQVNKFFAFLELDHTTQLIETGSHQRTRRQVFMQGVFFAK